MDTRYTPSENARALRLRDVPGSTAPPHAAFVPRQPRIPLPARRSPFVAEIQLGPGLTEAVTSKRKSELPVVAPWRFGPEMTFAPPAHDGGMCGFGTPTRYVGRPTEVAL